MLNASGSNYEGASEKITNVISSVATTDEFLESLVSREGEENDQFNTRISNAVNTLAPELSPILGDPSKVSFFFRSLGSFLQPEDRERIRDLLDSGVPNLPISRAICLTEEQLGVWDSLREELLSQYPDPSDIVDDLNDRTVEALGGAPSDRDWETNSSRNW